MNKNIHHAQSTAQQYLYYDRQESGVDFLKTLNKILYNPV